MTTAPGSGAPSAGRSTIKQALGAIDRLQRRLDAAEHARTEPIAIVGLACRFPGGVDSPQAFWQLLADGRDAITDIPAERWDVSRYYDPDPDTPARMYVRHGGFLRDVGAFDSWFFRISPREAQSLDPQHRLLLEVSWEALEDAGIAADALHGSATGVFVGLTTNDYAQLLMRAEEGRGLDAFFFTGNPANAAAGRLAYTFGFRGPALAIDTACSSSLVAIHQACASLRSGECRTALAGGVNLVLAPETTIAVCRTRALSPDGRCRTFDAGANGFVRSEGCGIVVLKRLSDAIADRDPIRAVIRGSAVNQDGASSGFTVPNGQAQQEVIRRALGDLRPSDVDYLEAHGTGTPLGDPIEVQAAAAVLGQGRPSDRPLYIGSVKTNVGHTEAAAGAAALIKTVLALQHGEIPPHLHCSTPNPLIPWDTLSVRVPSVATPWPDYSRPRRAGVSAFGASGTNAHVVLESAPVATRPTRTMERTRHVLVVSAKHRDALLALVTRYRDRLASDPAVDFGDVCFSASTGRVHHRHRTAIVAASASEAVAQLDAVRDRLRHEAERAEVDDGPRPPRIAFLFTGQGSQYSGMGRTLYETQPVFREALDRCAAGLAPHLDVPLPTVLWGDDERLHDTRYTQPAIFALQYALTTMLADWNIRPAVVMGHSVGEFAAACAAGALSLDAALALIATRGALMAGLPRDGAMTAVAAGEPEVREVIADLDDALSMAAINGPRSIVISGRSDAMAVAVDRLKAGGVRTAPLTVSHAFHSPLMDPILDRFEAAARTVGFADPTTTWISNLSGLPMTGPPDAAYWRRHCREAVRFADGIDAVVDQGCDVLVEIGPTPTLVRLAAQCRPDARRIGVATLAPGEDEWQVLLDMVAAVYTRGANPDWHAFDRPYARATIALPTYPFQRAHHWFPMKDEPMPDTATPTPPPSGQPLRRDAILALLRTYIAGLLQAPESEINIHLPFLEMGADSLVMVEAIGLVEKEYGLKLAIRRFFEDLSTIDALAGFIDTSLPADAPATAVPSATPAVTAPHTAPIAAAVTGAPAGSTPFERILVEQTRMMTQFMAQQAEVMRLALGVSPASNATTAAPAAIIARPRASVQDGRSETGRAAPPMPWGNPAEIRARGLTPAQHAHLEALIARYTARTRLSKERTQQYRAVLADSRATVGFRLSTKEMLYPIWGARTEGSRTWDIDGNEYIDFTMGFGVHLFGHKPDFIQQALREDLDRGVELGARADLVGEVAELFTELTGLDRVAFSNSGTEAVMAAVRLARAATGRDKIAIFTNAYHGHADTTLARAQHSGGLLTSVPMAPGVPGAVAADILVLEYGTEAALDTIRAHGHELAAVMVEPVQSRHLKQQPRAFLHDLRAITTDVGAALIFDEMITGFRAHPGGAQAYFGVKADLATYGKIVGGGMPIGLVAGTAAFMDGVDGGMWQYGDGSFPAADRTAFGGTFCQHPLSMAAARATLRHIKAEGPGLQARLNDRTDQLVRTLNTYFSDEEVPIEATHFSSLFRFEFSSNLDLLFYHMLEKGIYIWEWRSCFLSTAHSDADIDRFIDVVKESVEDLRRGGFAPRPQSGSSSPSGAGPSHTLRTEITSALGTGQTYRVPLSTAQRQLWLLLQIDNAGSIAYNVNTTLALDGALDAERLQAALQHVVDRHSALRTTIAADGTDQIIHGAPTLTLPLTDLAALNVEERERAYARWRDAVGREPLDLERGPVFRPQLIRLTPDRHVLMLSAHHIVADGITMGVILREMADHYNTSPVPPAPDATPPMQFAEYLALREQQRNTPEMREHHAFWLDQFADGVPQLDLPLDRARPPVKTYAGGRVTTDVDAETLDALKRLSRRHGCTLNMTLLAVFSLLLHRITGQDDVIVGTSVSGRPFQGSMAMAGYCTHLVPVRSRLEADPSCADLIAAIKRRLLDVFDHQDLAFADLVETLPIPRSADAFPMIAAVFNVEPVSELPAFDGLTAQLLPQAVSFTPFDLFVNVTEEGTRLVVDTDYNADLFDAVTARRWMQCFDTLLRAAAEMPSAPARTLPLLTPAERFRLVVEWNDTSTPYPDLRVHAAFEARAAERPDTIALLADGREVSYAALNERANQLAWWLRDQGVGPDVFVGICCERSVELMTAILGVLKAGGAYVPIDPEYPKDRVDFMLSDARPPVVLTQARWAGCLQHYAGQVLRLDSEWETVASRDTTNPDSIVTGDHLAYMIYTSGSTGRPKGALNTHHGITNRLLWMQDEYGLTPDDRILQKTPFSFDVSVWELLWPLMTGARLVMATPGGHRDPRYLVDVIEHAGVTTIHFVPSMLNAFLETPDLDRCRSLRRVICSGEALSPELLRRFTAALDVPIHNLYGPTECAVDVTAWACDLRQVGLTVPIGRPIANTQIYVLDSRRQPVPIGVAGEIYIGGDGVGRGYHDRPDLTRERFLPDPFPGRSGRSLYRTGDLARYRPDGAIEYLGRLDTQVKMRGFRIELGEIETRLLEQPDVSAAVVVADTTPTGETRLVAYIAVPHHSAATADLAKAHLARTLPDYMVPSAYVVLDEIPLLPNGKIDRRRLPAASGGNTHVTPEAGLEAAIAAIWENVLRQAPIGALDNFFSLGGNSLSAVQVVARIGRQLDLEVGIRDIFGTPTVRGLAARLSQEHRRRLPAITPLPRQPHFAASHAQRRFWIQDRLASDLSGNSHPASFLIEGDLDTAVLRRAFQALIARHEILRTVFVEIDGALRQRVLAPDVGGFDLLETTLPDDADESAALRALEEQQASVRMPLETGPLFRAQIVALGPHRHACICSLHHTITDGWSVGVLLNDLTALYDALVASHDDPLPPLMIQYRDYAAWENAVVDGPDGSAMREYWRGTLGDGVPPLGLSADLEASPTAYVRAVGYLRIDHAVVEALESVARRHGATLFMAMLACVKVLLYRHTAQNDICVGTPVSARVQPELEALIGPFLNILPLRDRVTGDDTWTEVLQRIRTTTLDAFAHQQYPFDRLVQDLRLKRVPERNPLFDVGFTLQNQLEVQHREQSRHLRMIEMARDDEAFEDPEAATDLWFVARKDEGDLMLQVVYNGGRFSQARVDRLSQDLLAIATAAGAAPETQVKSVLLSATEQPRAGRTITIDLEL